MKLWGGRFQKETDSQVNDFNSSISFDQRLYKQDITGSMAHAAMLGQQGIIRPSCGHLAGGSTDHKIHSGKGEVGIAGFIMQGDGLGECGCSGRRGSAFRLCCRSRRGGRRNRGGSLYRNTGEQQAEKRHRSA